MKISLTAQHESIDSFVLTLYVQNQESGSSLADIGARWESGG